MINYVESVWHQHYDKKATKTSVYHTKSHTQGTARCSYGFYSTASFLRIILARPKCHTRNSQHHNFTKGPWKLTRAAHVRENDSSDYRVVIQDQTFYSGKQEFRGDKVTFLYNGSDSIGLLKQECRGDEITFLYNGSDSIGLLKQENRGLQRSTQAVLF